MAKRTAKSTYPSRYSPGVFVTAAQYICEFICENKARKEGKDLPTQFWKQDEWAKYFAWQTKCVNQLLKTYPAEAIIAMLKANKHIYCFSAKSMKFIEPMIQKHNQILETKRMIADIEFDSKPKQAPINSSLPNKRVGIKSGMSKLIEQDEVL